MISVILNLVAAPGANDLDWTYLSPRPKAPNGKPSFHEPISVQVPPDADLGWRTPDLVHPRRWRLVGRSLEIDKTQTLPISLDKKSDSDRWTISTADRSITAALDIESVGLQWCRQRKQAWVVGIESNQEHGHLLSMRRAWSPEQELRLSPATAVRHPALEEVWPFVSETDLNYDGTTELVVGRTNGESNRSLGIWTHRKDKIAVLYQTPWPKPPKDDLWHFLTIGSLGSFSTTVSTYVGFESQAVTEIGLPGSQKPLLRLPYWCAGVQDVNRDGKMDLILANDWIYSRRFSGYWVALQK